MDVQFLCGKFSGTNFIYAIRTNPNSEWKYFKCEDSSADKHPIRIQIVTGDQLSNLPPRKLKTIDCKLLVEEKSLYFLNDKPSFNGEVLQSCKF